MKKFISNWGLPILCWFSVFFLFFLLICSVLTEPVLNPNNVTDYETLFASFGFWLGFLHCFILFSIGFTLEALIDVFKEKRKKRNAAQDKEASHD